MAMCEEATCSPRQAAAPAAAPDPPARLSAPPPPAPPAAPVPPAQVGAASRMQMPFVGARKAPPGTVVVIEVGLIHHARTGGSER